MNKNNQTEIDLFHIILAIWDGKWLMIASVCFALSIGAFFIFSNEPNYQAKLKFSTDTIPPFYEEKKAISDFEKLFFSPEVFEGWTKSKGSTVLKFTDFSVTESINGFDFARDDNAMLISLASNSQNENFLVARTKQLDLLNDIFEYASHTNQILTQQYRQRAADELGIIEERFANLDVADDSIVQSVLSIDRFIVSTSNGSKVLSIKNPEKPKITSTSPVLISVLSVLLGGMFGVLIIIISNLIRQNEPRSAKAK